MALSCRNARCLCVSWFAEWRTEVRLKSKRNAGVNKWWGNCQWAPFKSIVWNHPLQKAYNSPIHPHPAAHNGSARGWTWTRKLGLSFKSNTSVAAFTGRPVAGNTFQVNHIWSPDVTADADDDDEGLKEMSHWISEVARWFLTSITTTSESVRNFYASSYSPIHRFYLVKGERQYKLLNRAL